MGVLGKDINNNTMFYLRQEKYDTFTIPWRANFNL